MNAFAMAPEADITNMATCLECGHKGHSLYTHIQSVHGMTIEQYQAKHNGAPVLSGYGERIKNQDPKLRSMAPRPVSKTTVPSSATFGVMFGKNNDVDKPIPAYSGFDAEDRVPVADPNYLFQAGPTRDFILGALSGAHIYLSGPTGSGKTTLPEQFASRTGRPFYRQQFHKEMETIELLGSWTVVEGGHFEYLHSGLAQAIQKPSVVVFDEYDSGNSSVTAIANGLLDNKPLVLPGKGGEHIYKHPECIIVATGNTNGMGDETGLYSSTSVQSFATMNRFGMFIPINYMPAEDEINLLNRIYGSNASRPKGMPLREIQDMIKLANMIRDGFLGNELSAVLSTRQVINWGKWLSMTGDTTRSFNLAFANQLGNVDRQAVNLMFQKIYK